MLRTSALSALRHYVSLTSPGPLRQVGVRYINAVTVEKAFTVNQFVESSSGMVPTALLEAGGPFLLRVERMRDPSPNETWREVVNLYATSSEGGLPELVFDVDELYNAVGNGAGADVGEIAERLHEFSGSAFQSVMNERFRTGHPTMVSSEQASP